ncbi:oligosaccharide flippase family protein [Peribacillus muralis]|uniref:oligosaccharide flippase family protein n=1 Tax=Peribacillus muralis TaxID=264697 RepID=UPI00366BD6C4
MNSYNKLAKSSFIFAIGNLGSKIIFLLLVPIYTYYLSTDEYGNVDLITTTISLLLPITTLSIFDAVLRFSMDNAYEKKLILSNGISLTIVGFIFSFLLYPIFLIVFPFDDYLLYFYILLFFQSINSTFLQFLRAIDKLKIYAVNGILSAVLVLLTNIYFLIILNWNVSGFLISMIISNIISCIFIIIAGRLYRYFSRNFINIKLLKEMLLYSIPLIPNAVMWWVMGLSDRYIITYFLGMSANGLYAVANKIPSILNIVNSIFLQAWQLSAIEEKDSKSKSQFYTNVFNIFSTTIFLFTSILIIFLKIIIFTFLAQEFSDSWKYVPFLLLGIVFSSFSGFLGANYLAMKNTRGIFKTSMIGAIINIIGNFILIPIIGINGASLSTMISFMFIWIIRVFETKASITIKINYFSFIFSLLILLIQITVLYINVKYEYLIQVLLLGLLVFISRKHLLFLLKELKMKFNDLKST